jgi:hypothetical protein
LTEGVFIICPGGRVDETFRDIKSESRK